MKTMYWKILGAVALSGMLFALPAWAEEAGDMPQTQPAQCGSDLSYRDDDPLAGILECPAWLLLVAWGRIRAVLSRTRRVQ